MPSTDLRVKELLKEKGWTTKVLAEKTGMSESYLTHIKNGTRRWNEDSLRRIASAFGLDPVFLLEGSKCRKLLKEELDSSVSDVEEGVGGDRKQLKVRKVPMVGDIPSYPSPYNNTNVQVTTGFKEMFVPVIDMGEDSAFCLVVDNNSMSPRFSKGDCLVVSPSAEVESGDVVAVEYQSDKSFKGIMTINFSGNFIMLESVNHKQPPVAILKGKDTVRVIGKVVYVYQRYS